MASRPIISPFSVITNVSMAASITSPVGSMSVQVSNTYSQNADGTVRNAGHWTTLDLSSSTDVSGTSGNGFIDVLATAGYAIRLLYTRTSGTGTMNATIVGKVM